MKVLFAHFSLSLKKKCLNVYVLCLHNIQSMGTCRTEQARPAGKTLMHIVEANQDSEKIVLGYALDDQLSFK